MTNAPRRLLPALALVATLLLAGCAGAGAAASPGPTSPGPDPTATSPQPSDGSAPDGEGSAPGGGSAPADSGVEGPGQPGPGLPGNPAPGQPQLVVPKPGQQQVHPVAISELVARVEGRHVVLNAHWWSGTEPCTVLDSIDVAQDGSTFTVTLREGTSNPDLMCMAIAVEKVTVIDLGELDPGSYTVRPSMGDAPAISVVVP